jgi:hypothetical protein
MFYKEIAQDYFKIAYRIFHGKKYSVHWQVSTKTDNALEVTPDVCPQLAFTT